MSTEAGKLGPSLRGTGGGGLPAKAGVCVTPTLLPAATCFVLTSALT